MLRVPRKGFRFEVKVSSLQLQPTALHTGVLRDGLNSGRDETLVSSNHSQHRANPPVLTRKLKCCVSQHAATFGACLL